MTTKTAAAKPSVHRARIPADTLAVLVVQTVVLGGVWLAAMVVSYTGLVAAARWGNITGSARFVLPLVIDGILIAASIAYLTARERKDRASQWISLAAMLAFGALSMDGNARHALASGATGGERQTGMLLAIAAPVAILVTTELLARTVIASPDEHVPAVSPRAARRAAQRAAAAASASASETISGAPAQPSQPQSRATDASGRNADGKPQDERRATAAERAASKAALKARAIELAAEGKGQREIADLVGKSKTTVHGWLKESAAAGQTIGANAYDL